MDAVDGHPRAHSIHMLAQYSPRIHNVRVAVSASASNPLPERLLHVRARKVAVGQLVDGSNRRDSRDMGSSLEA